MAVLGNGIKGGASGSQVDMPGTAATAVAFSEPDEARAAFQQLIAPVSFQVPRETPLVWQVTSGELGPLTFVMDVVPGGFQLATADAEDRYVLVFQLAGTMSVDHGGTRGGDPARPDLGDLFAHAAGDVQCRAR